MKATRRQYETQALLELAQEAKQLVEAHTSELADAQHAALISLVDGYLEATTRTKRPAHEPVVNDLIAVCECGSQALCGATCSTASMSLTAEVYRDRAGHYYILTHCDLEVEVAR